MLLISAGIGATPVLAMLQALAEEHSDREIWWLHSARNSREHSFAAEARALLASLPNARRRTCTTAVPVRTMSKAATSTSRAVSPESAAGRTQSTPRCPGIPVRPGSRSWTRSAPALAALGIDASRIHTEPFGPAPGLTPGIAATPARAPHPPAGKPGNGPTIEFARSNLAIPWDSDYSSLLELAEACDVPVRWSCRTGVCHTCETTLIAGERQIQPRSGRTPGRRKRTHLLLTARATTSCSICDWHQRRWRGTVSIFNKRRSA